MATAAASTMPPSVASLPPGSQVQKSATSTLNQNDFLTLLTTQLEKQNPLNPTSPSDLAAELAQFSTATGVQNLQQTMQSSAGLQAASLIGHNVAVPGKTLILGQNGSSGAFNLSSAAKDVTVTISDTSGKIVATLDLGAMAAGDQNFSWNGKAIDGSAAAQGLYAFSVNATGPTGRSVSTTGYSVVPVTAVSVGGTDGAMVDLGGGVGPVSLSAIRQVF